MYDFIVTLVLGSLKTTWCLFMSNKTHTFLILDHVWLMQDMKNEQLDKFCIFLADSGTKPKPSVHRLPNPPARCTLLSWSLLSPECCRSLFQESSVKLDLNIKCLWNLTIQQGELFCYLGPELKFWFRSKKPNRPKSRSLLYDSVIKCLIWRTVLLYNISVILFICIWT